MKTAFVFPGGGSLGAIGVGMLKTLTEYGIQADMVIGTSVDFSKTPELFSRGFNQAKEWLEAGMLTANDVVPKVRPIHTHT